jgi:hypothetical protein
MLFPLYAHERSPLGLFKLAASTAVEGGMVGFLHDGALHVPEVRLYPDVAPATLGLVGLIDDSSSAKYGVGVDGIGVTLSTGATALTGTPTGPATHLASGKCTLWLDAGTFVTDTWDTTDVVLGTTLATTPVGALLSVDVGGTAGLLQSDVAGIRLGTFVRKLVGGQDQDFDSFFIPRVQPLPAGRILMVFRFKS